MTAKERGRTVLGCGLLAVMAAFSMGCALGTTRLGITHAPLDAIQQKKQGNLVVHPFVDKRPNTQYIGNKRNGFGMVLGHVGTAEGVKLDTLLTQYFVDALKEAGYSAVIEQPVPGNPLPQAKCDAIIDGDIVEFWMDLYMMVWHKVGVDIRAADPSTQEILWQKRIEDGESRILWVGATGEYERIVSEALTKALNRAAQDFASDDFYNKVILKK